MPDDIIVRHISIIIQESKVNCFLKIINVKIYICYIAIILFLFYSCCQTNQDNLLEIPVDINIENSILLSYITEEITAVELELTDENPIYPIRE